MEIRFPQEKSLNSHDIVFNDFMPQIKNKIILQKFIFK